MSEPSSYWCELAWLGGMRAHAGVALAVDSERIVSVDIDVPEPPAGATPLRGLTIPALANTHSHAFHRALRSRTHHDRGNFWSWRDLMYRVAGRLDPDSYYQLACGVFGEMALAGIGVVGEFHYVHHQPDGTPYDSANAMGDALVAAATEVGIRLTLLDTIYLHGGFAAEGSDPYLPLSAQQARFGDSSADAWVTRVEERCGYPELRLGAAIHSVRAVDPSAMHVVAAWSEANHAPIHVHVSEQAAENEQCRMRHSCSPVELLARQSVLGDRSTLVHVTHPIGSDTGAIAASGAGVCMCPTTERDLADGIGPSTAFAEADIPISLGSDSHAVIDLLEEARAVELDERLRSHQRGVHPAHELLTMATTNGYHALGWDDGGRLAEGQRADFTTIRLDSVRTAGADAATAVQTAVFAASSPDVQHVVVAGRPIVVGGRHVTLDVEVQLAESIASVTA